ncbi:MAG: hypothetical protein E3J43_09035 [Candidatus Heimdallarchaeota archaeon]|nr:MAG: hypothetical protein E3J43_09035 [Candidatus Heimdallarchaeota archaeon]
MTAKNEESIPSAKLKEIENGKVVVKPNNNKQQLADTPVKKRNFPFYLFISEIVILVLVIVCFSLMSVDPSLFFEIQNDLWGFIILSPFPWTLVLIFAIPALALLNTYFYIFNLDPKHRRKIYIVRFLSIAAIITLAFPVAEPPTSFFYSNSVYVFLIGMYVFMNYCFVSNIVLKTYLLTKKETTKNSLFRKAIAGSPAELEWRKYNTISGYLAIITGVLFLQFFWLLYHVFIRPIIVRKAKRKLLINSLNFEEEVNLTTVSLDIGISLEETIFLLKQLQLKRHLNIEFTRYGAVLKEVRKAKWFTFVIQEKYDSFLTKQKMTEYELKANRFIELTERYKLKLSDFRKVLEIDENFSSDDLLLLLPPKVARIRKPMFYTHTHIFFNHDQALLLREKITKTFVENGDRIFGKKSPETTAKTKHKSTK